MARRESKRERKEWEVGRERRGIANVKGDG